MIRYYRVTPDVDSVSPEIHEWLAEVDGLYLYVLKNTDHWSSPIPAYTIPQMVATAPKDVPAHVRLLAGRRLGGARRAGHFNNRAGGVVLRRRRG